jgi:hypothetical protein
MTCSRHKKLFSKFPHTKDTVQTHKNEQAEREKIHTKETKILETDCLQHVIRLFTTCNQAVYNM